MTNFLTKIIRFDDVSPTGEPTMRIITASDASNIKLASEACEYIKNIKPVDGKTFVLVLAMSSGEYYGPNRNGDAFSERVIPGVVEKGETLPDHYKTFETGAYVFKHHLNKDPSKSLGRVIKAFYNWDMHRVELLLELDNDKASDIIEKIQEGKYPAVSMGCRIKYDVCSICRNKAPTRAEYCDHAKYEMNRVYPDGKKAFVWNPSPNLFDISFVTRPADRIGYMMKKVAYADTEVSSAELGEKVADIQQKLSALRKLSDIDKIIKGQVAGVNPSNNVISGFCAHTLPTILSNTPDFDDPTLALLSQVPFPTALSTLGGLGISPTGSEISDMMYRRATGNPLPHNVSIQISLNSGDAIDLLHKYPAVLEAILRSGLLDTSPDKIDPNLVQKLGNWVEKRSNMGGYFHRRAQRFLGEVHPSEGNWDPVHTVDPNTGAQYQTTRGALDFADDANQERRLKTLAGAGLLTGAAYKAVSSIPGSGKYLAPLTLGVGALGATNLDKLVQPPSMKSIEGYDVPINTEMRKISNMQAAVPLIGGAALTALLAQEYRNRVNTGQLNYPQTGNNLILNNAGHAAYYHPLATTVAGIGATGVGMGLLERLGNGLSSAVKSASEDSVSLDEIDLDTVCYIVGSALVN